MNSGNRRDWWTLAGVAVVAVGAIVASFTAQAGLGDLAGWHASLSVFGVEVRLSWLLPLCVDAYGVTATRIAVNSAAYTEHTRSHALVHAVGAVVVSIVANAIYHALQADVLALGEGRWVLVVAVSMIPPVALGALAHLMALCARDDAQQQPDAPGVHATKPSQQPLAVEEPPAEPAPEPEPAKPSSTPAPAGNQGGTNARSKEPADRSRRTAPAPVDVDELMPLGWRIAADHQARGVPLTRDRLREAVRQTGQTCSTDRAGALLARLRTEAPADPADSTGYPVRPHEEISQGGDH